MSVREGLVAATAPAAAVALAAPAPGRATGSGAAHSATREAMDAAVRDGVPGRHHPPLKSMTDPPPGRLEQT
jgi:D-alanyl-D-alanine carboxypeptidase